MTDLAKRTWPEAQALFGPDTVALLPIGSTEPHGPHLPLDTDVTIAHAQAERASALMREAGVTTMLLPSLPYGLTEFTAGFPGAVSLRPGTLWAILEDIITSLEDQGVRRIVFCNAHLEPDHVAVIRGVILDHAQLGERTAQAIFPDNTRRRWAQTLNAEFQGGDCHAGSYETGIVMSADPDHVRESERTALEPVKIDLIQKMQAGAKNFVDCGSEHAYCGDPASATSDEGHGQVERLAEMVVTSCQEAWPDLFA